MAGLTDTDVLISSDGLVAYALTDAFDDGSGVPPASSVATEQFRMVTAMLRSNAVVPRDRTIATATRLLTAAIAYVYRGQSAEEGGFYPQSLSAARRSITLSNGDVIRPGGAFRLIPSAEAEPSEETDTFNRAFADAITAFDLAYRITGERSWALGRDASMRLVGSVMQFDGQTYTPGAVPVGTRFTNETRGGLTPAYIGQQITDAQEGSAVSNSVAMVKAAQREWTSRYPRSLPGLFIPVFYFDAPGSTRYGIAGTFNWDGPLDSYSTADQLRTATMLAKVARDTTSPSIRTDCLAAAVQVLNWFATDLTWLPSSPTTGAAWADSIRKSTMLIAHDPAIPDPISDAPHRLTREGSYLAPAFDPSVVALALQCAIAVDRVQRPSTGTMSETVARVVEKAVQRLKMGRVNDGAMFGTFSPDTDNHTWRGGWHSDTLLAATDLYEWCVQANNRYSQTAEMAKGWVDGLLLAIDALSADTRGGFIYGRAMWPLPVNWSDGIEEDFEFSTRIITADSGKEQRIARRTKPRRRLSFRHTLTTADEAAQYQAILRKRQRNPMLVPQWHMAERVGVSARVGDTVITLDSEPNESWSTAKALYLVAGDETMLVNVSRVTGREVRLREALPFRVPRGSEMMTVDYGLINPDLSSARAISTVIQAQVSFTILPQTDSRVIPPMVPLDEDSAFIAEQGLRWAGYIRRAAMLNPAVWPTWPDMPKRPTSDMSFTTDGAERLVITRKPNWANEVSIGDTWSYDLVDHYNAAITAEYGERAGRRAFQFQWTSFNSVVSEDALSVLSELRGSQVSCWVPSWSHDLTVAEDMTTTNRLTVERNSVTDEGVLLNDPSVAIHIETFEGTMYCVQVVSSTTSAGKATLAFDRGLFAPLRKSDIMRVSLMYLSRQAGDTLSMKWRAKGISEINASFITVQE